MRACQWFNGAAVLSAGCAISMAWVIIANLAIVSGAHGNQ